MKKVTFKKIIGENFLSLGNTITVNIDRQGIFIISGINKDKDNDGNGVGKSTIIELLFWTLFGETIRDLKKEEIVNNLAGKNCKGTVEFSIEKNGVLTEYRIERGISPSFCTIYINGDENKTLSTIPATNEFILKLISTTPHVFKNTITMGINSSTPFMAFKKNEKREFIEYILKLEIFKVLSSQAKEEYASVNKEYNTVLAQYDINTKNLSIYNEKSKVFDAEQTNLIKKLEKDIEDNNSRIEEIKKSIVPVNTEEFTNKKSMLDNLKKEISTLSKTILSKQKFYIEIDTNYKNVVKMMDDRAKEIKALSDKLTAIISNDITHVKSIIQDSETEVQRLKKENLTLEIEINNNIKSIDQINRVGSMCHVCKRPYEGSQVEHNNLLIAECNKIIDNNKIKIAENLNAIKNSTQTLNNFSLNLDYLVKTSELDTLKTKKDEILYKLESAKSEFEEEQKKSSGYTEKLNEIQIEVDTLYQLSNKVDMAHSALASIKLANDKILRDIDYNKNRSNEFSDLFIKTKQTVSENEDLLVSIKESLEIIDTMKYVLSEEGAKSFIIKKLIGILNDRINYYLFKLNACCTLKFNEFFEDVIMNDNNKECSYFSFSGGERKRIDLAILFAFMDLRRIQGDVIFNLAFFDELLDSAVSKDASLLIFEILKERFDIHGESSYIVTHRKENLKNSYINDIIWLEKQNGITKLGEYKEEVYG